jgi:cytidylate kinase
MRRWAEQRGVTLLRFSEMAERDPSIDREIDRLQADMVKEGNAVVDSRLGGWFVPADMKVWLRAPLEVRAQRVALRDEVDPHVAMEELRAREASEHRRYRTLYGIDMSDLSPYHVVLDTDRWQKEEVADVLEMLARALQDAVR